MRFAIRFISRTAGKRQLMSDESVGQIILGDFQERFRSLITFWKPQDYVRHWQAALRRITTTEDRSCLITSVAAPGDADYLMWWPMYRVGRVVYVQNAVLIFESLAEPLNLADPFASIPERSVVTEDGDPVSEWSVPVSSVQDFLAEEYGM
jgi:hypothetical protein